MKAALIAVAWTVVRVAVLAGALGFLIHCVREAHGQQAAGLSQAFEVQK